MGLHCGIYDVWAKRFLCGPRLYQDRRSASLSDRVMTAHSSPLDALRPTSVTLPLTAASHGATNHALPSLRRTLSRVRE
jgi:hypothetical protein